MVWQDMAEILLALLIAAYGFIIARITGDQRELERSMTQHRDDITRRLAELPDKYMRRDDFSAFRDDIMSALARIESKIDTKVDKP